MITRTPPERAQRVLIVEDEPDISRALGEQLQMEGFEVALATTGERGLELAAAQMPDLVILDLMLPGIGGETVLRRMRSDGLTMPVLILSARSEEIVKVHGFRLGADDYVTKPFGLLELLARVHALLRRRSDRARPTRIVADRLVFETTAHRVTLDDAEVALRPKERELLFALLDVAGQTVSRERLLRDVWGYADGVDSRTVDWHVAELRRKLEDDERKPPLIRTVRKVGYQLDLP